MAIMTGMFSGTPLERDRDQHYQAELMRQQAMMNSTFIGGVTSGLGQYSLTTTTANNIPTDHQQDYEAELRRREEKATAEKAQVRKRGLLLLET